MAGLEEYGIKDVGFVNGEALEGAPLVGYAQKDHTMDVIVGGSFKGKMYNVTRPGEVSEGAELFLSRDTSLWFDEVVEIL